MNAKTRQNWWRGPCRAGLAAAALAACTGPTSAPEAPAWRARAQDHLAQREYEASANAAGLQAPNRAHGLRTYFAPTGIRVVDRTAAGIPDLLALSLAGFGRSGAMAPVPPGTVSSAGPRVSIARAPLGLVEWYENSRAGLEQGFTIALRPPGSGALVLALAVEHAEVAPATDRVAFRSAAGRQLAYGKLAVTDAAGRALAAHFAPAPRGFEIRVEDAGAEYPIAIDPLLTSAPDALLDSDQAGAQLGASVAAAGDVNGDGYGDVIVGAPLYDAGEDGEGAAFVFLGGASGLASGDLASADARLESDQAGARLGASVASAGDVNGDGYADVVTGAPAYSAGEAQEGAAFVFLGGASGIASANPLTAHAQLESDQAGAQLGASVASAGDVNGDGYADVVTGAPGYSAGEAQEGAAFVFLGGASGLASANPLTAHAQLESDQAAARLGASVASAGDVNGDGYADVVTGAPDFSAGEAQEGAAFVFLGGASGIASANPLTAHAQLESDQAGAQLGASVASAGDVNGDGYADVVTGAPGYSAGEAQEGAAFVFPGSGAGVAGGGPASAQGELTANQASAQLGHSVASAGDVNGDGYADLIVGAPGYDAGESDEGAAFVFWGGAAGVADGDPATAQAQLESDQGGAQLGAGVAAAGDVNGDGYGDVLAGAPSADGAHADGGAVFAFAGGAAGAAGGDPASAHAQLESNQVDAFWGTSAASAGDVNGDGYGDVIVGAPNYDAGEPNEGAAFVFLGSALGIGDGNPLVADTQLESNDRTALFGYAVSSAGDVNADGYGDVIVGARLYDASQTDEGAAFIFLGSAAGVVGSDPSTAHAQLESNQAGAGLGTGVASAGDVNGDGYGDVIVGARLYDAGELDEGAAFLFLGSVAGIGNGDPATAHARLEADQASTLFGLSVASAGDVNGDGYGDVVVGAPDYDAGEVDEGAAFVFLGSASGIASGGPATAHAQIESDQAGAELGWSASSAGDVNGDGFADLLVGAYNYDAGLDDEGAVFVFAGSPAGIASGTIANAQTQLESDQDNAKLGYSVAPAGDVNGDGYADVIAGAYRYDGGELNEGRAFVFGGGPAGVASGGPASALSQLEADQTGAELGSCVASAGDVNGDGYGDVIASSRLYDAGESDEGASFVFLGNAEGRPVRAQQRRGDGSGRPVQPWSASHSDTEFAVDLFATSAQGRERARLELESCPSGAAFGDASCSTHVSPAWTDLGTAGAALGETVSDLDAGTRYHWRARVQYAPLHVTQAGISAPPNPRHGPWRRHTAQSVEADILPEPGALSGLGAGLLAVAALARRRARRGPD